MKVKCVWEHNGDDSILYASNFIGAFTRGKSKCEAIGKMSSEISSLPEVGRSFNLGCSGT